MADTGTTVHLHDVAAADAVDGSPENIALREDDASMSLAAKDAGEILTDDEEPSENASQVEAASGVSPVTPDAAADEDDHEDDGSLDVVVTGVEIDHAQSGASVVGAALLLGLPPYVVELVVSRARGSYCIRCDLTAFLAAVTAAIRSDANGEGDAAKCPDFPPKQSRHDAALAQWCADVTTFLADHTSALHASTDWVKLVADSSVASAQNRAHMTAIEFILQPFPYEKIYVPRGSSHEVVLPVKKEDQFLVWRFEVDDHDIDLTIHFLPTPSRRTGRQAKLPDESEDGEVVLQVIHPTTRFVATPGERPIEGMYECTGPGTATLVWDNSYSRLRGKNIRYQAQVVHRTIMDSAVAAADAYDEAIQAKIQREELIRSSKKKQFDSQLVVSPRAAPSAAQLSSSGSSYLYDTSAHLYRQLFADKLPAQNWIVSAPMHVAGKLASRLFGSPQAETEIDAKSTETRDNDEQSPPDELLRSQTDGREAKSLLEELNGLNMQLLERLESCEDTIARLTVERDQERSRAHLVAVEKENLNASLAAKDVDLQAVKTDLQRIERERGAWREIQQERDALLEEKHRWAMTDEFETENEGQSGRSDLDSETKGRLEHELGQAEASVLRLRAELGYSLTNHLTGTSTRLEKIAREMTASKKQYDDHIRSSEQEVVQLKQLLVKYRSQKRVLVAEIKNMQAQSESQVAVAMAEANEARMVNKRLKKQNELLLTQIRSLVDDAREQEKKLQDQVEQKIHEAQRALQQLDASEDEMASEDGATEAFSLRPSSACVDLVSPPTTEPQRAPATREVSTDGSSSRDAEDETATVPYTLSADDIALLNGQRSATPPRPPSRPSYETIQPAKLPSQERAERKAKTSATASSPAPSPRRPAINPHRERLVAFFEKKIRRCCQKWIRCWRATQVSRRCCSKASSSSTTSWSSTESADMTESVTKTRVDRQQYRQEPCCYMTDVFRGGRDHCLVWLVGLWLWRSSRWRWSTRREAGAERTEQQADQQTTRERHEQHVLLGREQRHKVFVDHFDVALQFRKDVGLCWHGLAHQCLVAAAREARELFGRARTRVLVHLALAEQHDSREALDLKALAQVVVLGRVHLGHVHLALELVGDLLVHGLQTLAVAAPRRVKLDEPVAGGRAARRLREVLKVFAQHDHIRLGAHSRRHHHAHAHQRQQRRLHPATRRHACFLSLSLRLLCS